MLERIVRTGEELILCDRDGKPIGVVIVAAVTPFRIYTDRGSFERNGMSLGGENTITEKNTRASL